MNKEADTLETLQLWHKYLDGERVFTRDIFDLAHKLEFERDKYRSALKGLHTTIQLRMSTDNPSPEDRLAIWSSWKAAGQVLQENFQV